MIIFIMRVEPTRQSSLDRIMLDVSTSFNLSVNACASEVAISFTSLVDTCIYIYNACYMAAAI